MNQQRSTETINETVKDDATNNSSTRTQTEILFKTNRNSESITVGTFTAHNGQKKHYALVPDALISSKTEFHKLMKYWKLPAPDFILEMNPSNEHDVITTENVPHMLQDVFFREVNSSEQDDRTKQGDRAEPEREGSTRKPQVSVESLLEQGKPVSEEIFTTAREFQEPPMVRQEDLEWANKYVIRKTVESLSSLVSVADMMGGWILCRGAPTANEKMLEAAIDNTGSDPCILVVDDIKKYISEDDYKYWEDKATKMGDPMKQFSKTLKPDLSINDPMIQSSSTLKSDLSFDTTDAESPSTPLPAVIARGASASFPRIRSEDSQQWRISSLESSVTGGPKWEATFPWLRGTHFIFSKRFNEFSSELFETSHASVCMHGNSTSDSEPGTGVLIREAVSSIRPCLLFNNTGGQTQAYARLIQNIRKNSDEMREKLNLEVDYRSWPRSCVSCICNFLFCMCMKKGHTSVINWNHKEKPHETDCKRMKKAKTGVMNLDLNEKPDETDHFYDELIVKLRKDAWKLQKHANLGSKKSELSIADVLQIVDLYCENPRLFTNVVIPVDPLNHKPDSIVESFMRSISRSQLERKEVGAGDADDNSVMRAWRFHHQLGISKRWKEGWRTFFYSCFIIAGICATLVAVWSTTVEDSSSIKDSSEEVGKWITLILGVVASLSSGILNLTGADRQLIKIQTAQAKIVFEIFQFRLRVGKYSLNTHERTERDKESPTSHKGTPKPNNSTNTSTRLHLMRENFSQEIKDISTELASLDLYADPLTQGELTESYRRDLELHIAKALRLKKMDEKAMSGIMTSWDYYNLRITPLLAHLEKEEDKIRFWTRTLQVLSMFSSSITPLLSAANKIEWVPITVAGATGFSQYLKVYDLERRFETISKAARELGALDNNWQSLSDIDKYIRSYVAKTVTTCEDVALQYETTSVIKVDKASLGMDENDNITPPEHAGLGESESRGV